MKRFLPVLFILAISLLPKDAFCTHAAGGELIYEWKGGSQYLFTFKFYRDCYGKDADAAVVMCIYNGCTGQSRNVVLRRIATLPDGTPNGSLVSTGCAKYKTTCEDTASNLPGYTEWWYQATEGVANCDDLRFSVSVNARNPSQNVQQGVLYVEATLNNKDFPGNNSTAFYTKPVPYVCINNPFTFNNGAIDADNDSLVFEVIRPLAGANPPCSGSLIPLNFLNIHNPPLSIPTNPFQTNNTYSLNSVTGEISYTPAQIGPHTTAIRVKEYRDNILVGSTIRDIQVQVQNCNNTGVEMILDTNSITNAKLVNGVIETCYGVPFSFCYDVIADQPNSILAVRDNQSIAMPTANTTYNNNLTDNVEGCFAWTAAYADGGLKTLVISAKDSTCTAPGVSITHVFTIPIRIHNFAPPPNIITPQYLCENETATALTAQGQDLMWYPTQTSTTGSVNAPIPNTTTPGTTDYFVTQTMNYCESDKAVIEVEVQPELKIDIGTASDTLCEFDSLSLFDNAVQADTVWYTWDVDAGGIIFTQKDISSISTYWNIEGLKNIITTVNNGVCTSIDTVPVYVVNTPVAAFDIDPVLCIGVPTLLKPVDQPGEYAWTVPEQNVTDKVYIPSYELTWDNLGQKVISLTITGDRNCQTTYTQEVNVYEVPEAKISIENDDLCIGDVMALSTPEGLRYKYDWSPPQFFNNNNQNRVTGTVERTGYIQLDVINQWGCVTQDSLYLSVVSCCDIFIPDAFTPNGDGVNDEFSAPEINRHRLLDFTIVHRRGNIVFQSADPTQKWDGTYKGEKMDVGTYSYYIKYICKGEEVFKKGMFHLLR